MLVLALLFAPVLADAGNPREPEFTQPANATVAGAAAVAGFGGWLFMADSERTSKKARLLGPMDHYMNALPPERNTASAADRSLAAAAPDLPLHDPSSAASSTATAATTANTANTATATATALSVSMVSGESVPDTTSLAVSPAAANSPALQESAQSMLHRAPRYEVGAQWGYTNRATGEIEAVRTVRIEPTLPGDDNTYLVVQSPKGRERHTLGSLLFPIPNTAQFSPAAAQPSPTAATPAIRTSPSVAARQTPPTARPGTSPATSISAAAGQSATAPKRTKRQYVHKGAVEKGAKDYVIPFPDGDLEVVGAEDALPTQREWLLKTANNPNKQLPSWVQITRRGLACVACRYAPHHPSHCRRAGATRPALHRERGAGRW